MSSEVGELNLKNSVGTAEKLAADLMRAILAGELLPGEPIRQDEWAVRFKVSKVPFREALKLLSARHLITHSPNRGYFVPKMVADDLAQIYEIRAFLEKTILESVRWPTTKEFAKLRGASERAIVAARSGDVANFLQEEEGFFFGVYDLSSLGVYVREAKHFWKLCDQYRATALLTTLNADPNLDHLLKQRGKLLQAIEDHNHTELVTAVSELRVNLGTNLHFAPLPV